MAILSFADKDAELFFEAGALRKGIEWRGVDRIVRRKLDMLHYAALLKDLASPPGNRLEALKGKWQGRHSIRVNDQWRIVFKWSERGVRDVCVTDYH
jgi:toxin HigB-1